MADAPSRSEWETVYHSAILETDDSKVLTKINAAEVIIGLRVESLERYPTGDEPKALVDALIGLHALRRERVRPEGS